MKHFLLFFLEYLQRYQHLMCPTLLPVWTSIFTMYSKATETQHLCELFSLASTCCGATFCQQKSVSGSEWKVLRRDRTPPVCNPSVHQVIRPPVKWNTPLGFHRRHSGSRPGCWKGNLGCLPVWRPSLPGSDTSLFSGRGIWQRPPGRSRSRRSPLLWRLQGRVWRCKRLNAKL